MAITNLGTASYRPSVMGQLPAAVQAGQEMGLKRQEMDLRKRKMVEDEKRDKTTLQTELANQEFKEKKLNQENTYKALENLSLHMNSMKSDADRDAFKQGDTYKQISDLAKNYLPEYWDKNKKEVMLVPNKSIYEDKLKAHRVRIADTIASGSKLSPADMKLKDFLDKVDVRIASAAIASAEKNSDWDYVDDAGKSKMVQESLKRLQTTRQSVWSGGSEEQTGGNPLSSALSDIFGSGE